MEFDGETKQAVIGWDLSRVVFRDLEKDYPVVERGEGIYLFDTKGRKYIDGSGGSSVVTSIGHGNKRVAAVMATQAETIAFSPAHCFANKPHIELCQKIAEIAPKEMAHAFLLSGGSEATENAVKFARQYEFVRNNRGKYTVIGRWQGFHGNTFGAMTVSGHAYRRQIYGPMLVLLPLRLGLDVRELQPGMRSRPEEGHPPGGAGQRAGLHRRAGGGRGPGSGPRGAGILPLDP
jgi:4-aminobutyrate aminotransferase-like enzyme